MWILNKHIINFKYFFLIIIVLILFLLSEGMIHNHYQIFSYYFYSEVKYDRAGYNPLIWNENGLVEILQVIVLFLSIIILFKYILSNLKNLSRIFQIILSLYLIGLIYYFFEEISWGQHLFFWKTPDIFSEMNSQNETNLHNISNLFNELPRTFLLIFCTFSFLFKNLIAHKSKYLSLFILPNSNLMYLSYLIMFFVLPDFIVDIFDISPIFIKWPIGVTSFFEIDLVQLISFNFIRLSELQELLFNFYIISHAYYLKTTSILNEI